MGYANAHGVLGIWGFGILGFRFLGFGIWVFEIWDLGGGIWIWDLDWEFEFGI